MDITSKTYTQREVAILFGYSEKYFSTMVRKGIAPVDPIPGTKKYSRTVVDGLLNGQLTTRHQVAVAQSREAVNLPPGLRNEPIDPHGWQTRFKATANI